MLHLRAHPAPSALCRGFLAVVTAAVVAGIAPAPAAGEDALPPDPRRIVARAFQNLYGFSSVQRVEIRSRPADGRAFLRSAQIIRRGIESQGLNRMLVRMLGPEDLRGIGLLLEEHENHTYDAFLYQPALARVRRVSVAQRHDSFFGTDLWFEDLEGKRAAQWSVDWVRKDEVFDRSVAVLSLEPRHERSGYDRLVLWFDEQMPVFLRGEFYRKGALVKVLEIQPGDVESMAGFFVPLRMTLQGEDGSETVVEITEIEIREELPQQIFSVSSLEFGDDRSDLRATQRREEKP